MQGAHGITSAYDLFGKLFTKKCVDPKIKLKGCIKIKKNKIAFGIKASFWIPVAIVTVTTKTCDLGPDWLEVLFPVLPALERICKDGGDVPVIKELVKYSESSPVMNDLFSQNYARYQVHVFAVPQILIDIAKAIITTEFFIPCFSVDLENYGIKSDAVKKFDKLFSVYNKKIQIPEKLKKYVPTFSLGSEEEGEKNEENTETGEDFSLEDSSESGGVTEALGKLLSKLPIPCFFSEFISPVWGNTFYSPDTYTILAATQMVMDELGPAGSILSEGICQATTIDKIREKLSFVPDVAGTTDLGFLCVGNWGHGYPRVGIVRNDNPLVAELLASARFLHLFSKTVPIFPHLKPEDVKFQVVFDLKDGDLTDCFRVGDRSIPFKVGSSEGEVIDIVTHPEKLLDLLKDVGEKIKSGRIDASLPDKRRIKLTILVWRKFDCCDF